MASEFTKGKGFDLGKLREIGPKDRVEFFLSEKRGIGIPDSTVSMMGYIDRITGSDDDFTIHYRQSSNGKSSPLYSCGLERVVVLGPSGETIYTRGEHVAAKMTALKMAARDLDEMTTRNRRLNEEVKGLQDQVNALTGTNTGSKYVGVNHEMYIRKK